MTEPTKKDTPVAEKPMPVTIVPNDGKSDAERAAEAEAATPENTKNRNASYEPSHDAVNFNDPKD